MALVMTHVDDNGLVLPPDLAPYQVVFIPIFKSPADLEKIINYIEPTIQEFSKNNISFHIDKGILSNLVSSLTNTR